MSAGRALLFFLTAVSFLLAGFAVWVGPPPLWVPLSFFGIYVLVLVGGAMNLRLRMYGDALCSVPDAHGKIALTFDDGPDPIATREVLSILKDHDAHATFFVVGHKAERHPEVLREIVRAGHSLGVHSYDHNRLYSLLPPRAVEEDIRRTRDIVEAAVGVRPIWFRPPVGQMSPRTARGVELSDAIVVGWNVRAVDGLKKTTKEQAVSRVTRRLERGAIVLLHDAWEREEVAELDAARLRGACPAGVQALPAILDQCASRGLRPVTIEQLIAASPVFLSEVAS